MFTWKKSSTVANLLMEKPGNWFAVTKMWETEERYFKKDIPEEERYFEKKTSCIFT